MIVILRVPDICVEYADGCPKIFSFDPDLPRALMGEVLYSTPVPRLMEHSL